MDHDPALNVTTLFDLAEAVRLWCPVAPEFGDMRDAAGELIYLLVSRRTHADRLQTVMHQRFFPAFPDLDAIRDTDRGEIEAILRPLGNNRRAAATILGVVQGFHERGLQYDDETMRRLDDQGRLWILLEAMPGVGTKILECLRVFAFGRPGVPLDAHNWRVMWRFGAVASDFLGKRREPAPEKIRAAHLALRKAVPNADGAALHNRLMLLGGKICTARGPRCGTCPLTATCARRGLATA